MISEKRALGKGLSALISENLNNIPDKGSKEIPIGLISSNPFQPRKHFDVNEIQQLSDSIKEHGILQPIIVRERSGGYEIIAGERRWRAASASGLKTIPANIIEVDDNKMFEIAIIENIQRQNLNPIEEAQAFKRMIDDLDYKQETVAKKVGKSREYVSNMMRLLKLPTEVQAVLADGKITAGHARALINAPEASNLVDEIIKNNLSVRDTENLIKNNKNRGERKSVNDNRHYDTAKPEDVDMNEVSKIMEESLGMKVRILDSKYKGGEVRISFMSYEQLDYLIQKLSGDKLNF